MRVLHVARFFHPHAGGTETFIASLAAATGDTVESHVLCTNRYRGIEGPAPRIPVTTIPAVGPDRFPAPAGGFSRIARAMRAADVVHIHDMRFLFETLFVMSRRMRKPIVLSTHGLIFHTAAFSGIKRALWRGWYVPALKRFDRVVAVSRQDRDYCEASGIRDNLELVPNAVDVSRFIDVVREPDAASGPLLYFGRISEGKGVDRLSSALAQGDRMLDVIGTGDRRSLQHAHAGLADFASRVRWRGYASDEDLRKALAGCSCVVLPSRSEGFGLAMIEALAAGAPVVAADIPAFREIMPPRGVALADFDDARAVAAAIDDATRTHDPGAAKEWASRFDWKIAADQFRKIYAAIVEGH